MTTDSKLQICQLGNPVLRHTARPATDIQDAYLQKLIDDLLGTLTESNGVGIAAPQVAKSLQLLIVASRPNARYPNAPLMEPTAMINPTIIARSQEMVKDWEGCLSVPGIRGLVTRHKEITVEYSDRNGNKQTATLTDFIARIFQHEYDHLEGKVFLDRVESSLEIITDAEYLKLIEQDRAKS